MKAKKMFFKETHLAGRQYHDADEVWNKLHVGTILKLVRDTDNRYDPNAVAVLFRDKENQEDYLLGYIPREDNREITNFLEMGWTDIFECRINKISPDTHYEDQIRLTIRIKKNEANKQ